MKYLPFTILISFIICFAFSCETNTSNKKTETNRFATDSLFQAGDISFQLDKDFKQITQRTDLDIINFNEGFTAPYLGTFVRKNIYSWLDQNALVFYKSLGKEQCDLIIFIEQTQPVAFDKQLLPEFTKNFRLSLLETYKKQPNFVEENYLENYNNIYYQTKFATMLEDDTKMLVTNYIINNNKAIYGMLVTNFGGHNNDYRDIMATLEMK